MGTIGPFRRRRRRGAAEMESTSVGLEVLNGLILDTILTKLGPTGAVAVACSSTRLRAAASDDNLWRRFCSTDLDLLDPHDPDGNPCPSFKIAYKAWRESFSMYPLPLVKRAKQCWGVIKNWMSLNFPEAGDTLQKGASEAEIEQAEEALKLKLPAPTRVLYRFFDGQATVARNSKQHKRLAPLGVIGGYEFYGHLVCVHLLPLKKVVLETKVVARQLGFSNRAKYAVLAASYYSIKWFFLNCTNGQLYVGTKNLIMDGEMMPCVPQALVKPGIGAGCEVPQDALLLWLEEYGRRLQAGVFRTREKGKFRTLSLYPEAPPACSVAVTNGVQVRASAVLVPEASDLTGGEDKYLFSYSIRLSLLPEGCMLDGMYFSACQLHSRHWIIRCRDVEVSDVHGEGVIGKFPLLLPNQEEFIYESYTPLPATPGSVEGSFTFFPGRLSKPEGRQFDVKVAPFVLETPDYVF